MLDRGRRRRGCRIARVDGQVDRVVTFGARELDLELVWASIDASRDPGRVGPRGGRVPGPESGHHAQDGGDGQVYERPRLVADAESYASTPCSRLQADLVGARHDGLEENQPDQSLDGSRPRLYGLARCGELDPLHRRGQMQL